MTEGLEGAGFDRRQSNAAVHAIANAIDKFAVTPERMREALERNNDILMERIETPMDERFMAQNQLFDEKLGLQIKLFVERFGPQARTARLVGQRRGVA